MLTGVPRPPRILVAIVLALAVACTGPSETEISRDRAIEIARQQITFQPDTTDVTRTTSNGRPVWRVTFRGTRPGQPPGLFETATVDVDRSNGEIVSIARP
jgi:Peptidase propeptide and YPEB domain